MSFEGDNKNQHVESFLHKFKLTPQKALLYTPLIILGIVLKEHMFAFLLITILFFIDFTFNVILRFLLRPIYKMVPLGIELVMFNVVIISLALGPVAGMICGVLFGTAYYGVIFGFRSTYQFVNIPFYVLIGYIASALPIDSLLLLGMVCSLIYSVGSSLIITIFFGGKISKSLIFISSNLLFNYWMFSHLSDFVLNLIL